MAAGPPMMADGGQGALTPGDNDRARLASIVENSYDAIIGKTLDGIVTSWNRAAELLFGHAAEEMVGRSVASLFPPDLLDEEERILQRLRRGERIEPYETVRLRKDGRVVPVSLSVSPILDAAGRVIGASKIVRDLTERKRADARLEELQTELLHVARLNEMGQMASAFAHELNQPLSAVSSYLTGVRRLIERGDLERAAYGCEQAVAQVARAGEVIRSLRGFLSKGDKRREVLNLAQLVEDSSRLALVGARAAGVSSVFELSPAAATALMDRVQIQQVMVNLVRNAVEAMASSPLRRLTVATRAAPDGMVEVSIADTGPGLSEQIRSRLFQPFATTKADGMGVGLSLCRTIIEEHGGRIWADDGTAGGALFRFTLPRC